MIIDVWMQHPTPRVLAHEMFDSLRRWTRKQDQPSQITPQVTIEAMDQGGVQIGLACAWCSPKGWLIDHDEVAALAKEFPRRIVGVAGADLDRPMQPGELIRWRPNDRLRETGCEGETPDDFLGNSAEGDLIS